jgi:hypothetical protein
MTDHREAALSIRLRTAFECIRAQKGGSANLSLQPMWDIVNAVPEVLCELRRADKMREAILEHGRFNREDLGYSGPDDPAVDPACGEGWQRLLNSVLLTKLGDA